MSDEATVSSSLRVQKGSLRYSSQPPSFSADVSGTNGPTPGAVTVATTGTAISLAQLTAMGGLCRVMNLDDTNKVRLGVREISSTKFLPLIDLLPGESFVFRLSSELQKEEVGTGTFTGPTTQLYAKAVGAACVLLVEAFDP